MLEIEKKTCIRFEDRIKNLHQEPVLVILDVKQAIYPVYKKILVVLLNKTLNKDFIEFRLGKGCYSSVGRDGKRQFIVLNPRCAEKHTLIHEVISVKSKIKLFEGYIQNSRLFIFHQKSENPIKQQFQNWGSIRYESYCIRQDNSFTSKLTI